MTHELCGVSQGDDYILHVHPKEQKLQKSERLREWYLMMLRRAQKQGIVTHLSNLYDTFFEGGKDHRLPKCSIKDLPYFEGARSLLGRHLAAVFLKTHS